MAIRELRVQRFRFYRVQIHKNVNLQLPSGNVHVYYVGSMNFAVVTFPVDLQHWPKSYLLNLDSALTLT